MNLIGRALRLEQGDNMWLYELLIFIVVCPLIIVTGRRNAALAGPEGYSYSRAVGYVFALMMFAGIVYGVGRFLMVNYISHEYYDALNTAAMDAAMTVYRGTAMESQMATMRPQALRVMSNPLFLIFSSVFNLVIKGGFLGLIFSAFFKRNPDIFADRSGDASHE